MPVASDIFLDWIHDDGYSLSEAGWIRPRDEKLYFEVRAYEGVPIRVIQHALGHANVAITSLYISHLSPNAVIDTLKQREWAAA